jgi:ribose-phosphate pyrophosphokinase
MNPLIVHLPGDEALAAALQERLPGEPCALQLRAFPDHETYVRVLTPVAGRDVVVACNLAQPNARLAVLYLLCSTLRSLGPRRLLLVSPYLPYMRQDQVFHPGEGRSAEYLARWISSFVDGLVTVEPHLHRIHHLHEIFTIPTQVVQSAPPVGTWVRENVSCALIVGPDAESRPWVDALAQRIGRPGVVMHKIRHADHEVQVSAPNLDKYLDCTPVLLDDIISTGGTLRAAIRCLRSAGFAEPVCIGVHALFDRVTEEVLRHAGAARIVSCNTIPHPSNAIDVHPGIALGVRALLSDSPVARALGGG